MNLKDARMLQVWFEFCGRYSDFPIKINTLRRFCAVVNPLHLVKSKTNEMANVCASPDSFMFVMFSGLW